MFRNNTNVRKCFSVIRRCTVEQLSRLAPLQSDIAREEKIVDQYIDLLRRDMFDENTSTDGINKAINYFEVYIYFSHIYFIFRYINLSRSLV